MAWVPARLPREWVSVSEPALVPGQNREEKMVSEWGWVLGPVWEDRAWADLNRGHWQERVPGRIRWEP